MRRRRRRRSEWTKYEDVRNPRGKGREIERTEQHCCGKKRKIKEENK